MISTSPLLAEQPADDVSLASAYRKARQASIDLTAGLDPEDCVIQTIPEVSPTKWHIAHTTWFFEQFCLLESSPAYRPYQREVPPSIQFLLPLGRDDARATEAGASEPAVVR